MASGAPYSSLARDYAIAPLKRVAWMDVDYGLGLFSFNDSIAGRRRVIARLYARPEAILAARRSAGRSTASPVSHSAGSLSS